MRTVRQLLESKAPGVYAIGPDAPVIEAIRLMAEKRIGALLVMEAGAMAGIDTERD
jgi:CBS domain-containing protein